MKICVAQTRPHKSEVLKNIEGHNKLIELALPYDVDVIIFPELSVTGYEPEIATELATNQDDDIFDHFQNTSDKYGITIGVGMPTKDEKGTSISMILFQPQHVRKTYHKKYIHADEEAHFVSNTNFTGLIGPEHNIAPAICYELSVPEHSEAAAAAGASYYVASAVKSQTSLEKSYQSLADIAKKYGMVTMISNCVGMTGEYECPGGSAVWNRDGILLASLNAHQEGILIYNNVEDQISVNYLS